MSSITTLLDEIPGDAERRRARLVLARVLTHPGFDSLRRRWHHIGENVFARQWEISVELAPGRLRWFWGPTLVDACLRVEFALDHPDHPEFR